MDINVNNFASTMATIIRSSRSQRESLQGVIGFAANHYKETGDSVYLTRMMRACVGVKSLPTQTMKNYITGHTNLTYTKAKDGSMVFKKVKKGEEPRVDAFVGKWYEYEAGHQAKKDIDALVQAKALLTRIQNGLKEGKVKDQAEAEKVVAALKVLAA